MAKQVRETTAGASISAFVVLNKHGEHVATVNAHYSNGGRVSVDVWNIGDAVTRSFETARRTGRLSDAALAKHASRAPDYYTGQDQREQWAAHDLFGLQQASAGGYGYDKFAAALAGLIIDGHTIADHSGSVPESEKARQRILAQYKKAAMVGAGQTVSDRQKWQKKADAIGAHFCNWCTHESGAEYWADLHFTSGLSRLEAFGYRVIQAI